MTLYYYTKYNSDLVYVNGLISDSNFVYSGSDFHSPTFYYANTNFANITFNNVY